MYEVIEALEKQAPGYTYGASIDGHVFVNGKKTEVVIREMASDAPQDAIEAAASAVKESLIIGSHIEK